MSVMAMLRQLTQGTFDKVMPGESNGATNQNSL
jgi:hypothetical protein